MYIDRLGDRERTDNNAETNMIIQDINRPDVAFTGDMLFEYSCRPDWKKTHIGKNFTKIFLILDLTKIDFNS